MEDLPVPSAPGRVSLVTEGTAEIREALDIRAKAEGRSRSDLILTACLYYLRYAPVTPVERVLPPPPVGHKKPGRKRKTIPSPHRGK